jgi:hypothetical protein
MCLLISSMKKDGKNFFDILKVAEERDPELDPYPDPHQNITDPQLWIKPRTVAALALAVGRSNHTGLNLSRLSSLTLA